MSHRARPAPRLLSSQFSRAGEGIVLLPPNDDPRSDEEQWMISAFDTQTRAGLAGASVDSGGCKDLHVGVVAPGRSRGAHRHRGHNESIIVWGGSGVIRVERPGGAYQDYKVTPEQRVLVASPAGLGHGIKCDEGSASAMSIVACSDAPPTRGPDPASDYKIWSDW